MIQGGHFWAIFLSHSLSNLNPLRRIYTCWKMTRKQDKTIFTIALAQYIFFNFHLPLFPPEVENKKIFNFFTELTLPSQEFTHFLNRAWLFVFQCKIYSCLFVCLYSKNLSVIQKKLIFYRKTSLSHDIF